MELALETAADGWEVEALFDLCFAPGREALSSYRLREGVAPVAPLCLVLRDGATVAAAIRHWPVRIGPADGREAGQGASPGADPADAGRATGSGPATDPAPAILSQPHPVAPMPPDAPAGRAPGAQSPADMDSGATAVARAGALAGPPAGIAGTMAKAVPALLLGPVAVHPTRQGEGLGAWLIQESLARARALGWDRVMLVGDAPYYARFGFARLDGVVMPPPTNPARVLGHAMTPGAWKGISGPVRRAPG